MESVWRRAGVQLGKYWYAVLGLMVVLTGLLTFGLKQLDFATGQDSYLNPDSQVALDNVDYQENFGGETLIVLFESEEGRPITDLLTGDNLAELRRINEALHEIDAVYSVVDPISVLGFSSNIATGPGSSITASAAARDDDPASLAIREEEGALTTARASVGVAEPVLENPAWLEFLLYDNAGYSVDADGSLTSPPVEDRVMRSSVESAFPNPNVSVAGILLQGNATLDELQEGTDDVLEVMDSAEFDGIDVLTTGSPVYLGEINDYLQGGMLTLGAAAFIVMTLVLLVMFRVRWRLLPLAAVGVGVIWTFALLGAFGIDLSLVTISGLPILIGLGIDFAIQIHNRVEEEVTLDHAEHPMSETLANLGPALLTATVAGVVAFLALQISQVPMIRDFGVTLAIGIIVFVAVGIVLPTAVLGIREYRGRTTDRGESWVEKLVVRLGSLPAKLAPAMIIASVLLFIAGVALEGRFNIESDPLRWIDQDSEVVDDVATLENETGFSSTLGILVQSNNVLDEDVIALIDSFNEEARGFDQVKVASSLVDTVKGVINPPGTTQLVPTPAELDAVAAVMPDDIARVLLAEDRTATQLNLRLAPGSLDDRADLVERIDALLADKIEALEPAEDSLLRVGLDDGDPLVRANSSGLAVVGVGLLDNLSANRATLTYFGLAMAALWLLIRFRSLPRALLTLVPIGLAVGTSSVVIGAFGLTLSPLTTVSGPLVVATCTEFAVLILARYLEERQRGLDAKAASDQAAGRTGRAFFTSAATTIGGFAVLIGSALPLLRDFGIIVTLNVAVALLAALVVMPPLLVWADNRGLLATGDVDVDRAVVLAAKPRGPRLAAWGGGLVVAALAAIALYGVSEKPEGSALDVEFTAQQLALPDDGTGGDDGAAGGSGGPIDPTAYGSESPGGLVGDGVFDAVTGLGATPEQGACTASVLLERFSEADLLGLGIAAQAPEATIEVGNAAADCGVDPAIVSQINPDSGPTAAGSGGSADGPIDPTAYGSESPGGLVGDGVFDAVTGLGATPEQGACTASVLLERFSEADLLGLGIAAQAPEATIEVGNAAADCGVDPAIVSQINPDSGPTS